MIEINLGEEVKDEVSGFKGIAIASHKFLNGCRRITVQPRVKRDGTLPEERSFDEPQLIVTKKKPIKRGDITKGGPAKSMPQAKSTGGKR